MDNHYGQIGLVASPENLHQRIITKVTGSPIYHVIVAVSEIDCISPGPDGVTVEPISDYPDVYWSDYSMTSTQANGVVKYALSTIERTYNWLDSLLIALEFVLKLEFPSFMRKYVENGHSYQCALLAYDALTIGGQLELFEGKRPPGGVYPGLFEREFIKNGWETASTHPKANIYS